MSDYWTVWGFIALPIVLSVVVTLATWRKLSRPILFLVTGILALTGLQSFIAPAVVAAFFPIDGGASREAVSEAFFRSAMASAIVVLVVGTPYLVWLQRALRKVRE